MFRHELWSILGPPRVVTRDGHQQRGRASVSLRSDVRGVVQPEHVGPPRLPDPVQLRCPTHTAKHGVALKRLQTKRRPKPMPEANISQESSMRANGPAPMSPYANHRNGAGGQYRNGWTQSTDGTFPSRTVGSIGNRFGWKSGGEHADWNQHWTRR